MTAKPEIQPDKPEVLPWTEEMADKLYYALNDDVEWIGPTRDAIKAKIKQKIAKLFAAHAPEQVKQEPSVPVSKLLAYIAAHEHPDDWGIMCVYTGMMKDDLIHSAEKEQK